MKKKYVAVAILIIIVLLIASFFVWRQKQQNETTYDHFPSSPTQEERDAARKLPQSECSCWVAAGTDQGCHPQEDCI